MLKLMFGSVAFYFWLAGIKKHIQSFCLSFRSFWFLYFNWPTGRSWRLSIGWRAGGGEWLLVSQEVPQCLSKLLPVAAESTAKVFIFWGRTSWLGFKSTILLSSYSPLWCHRGLCSLQTLQTRILTKVFLMKQTCFRPSKCVLGSVLSV